jgi:nitric oxide reductase activation protein
MRNVLNTRDLSVVVLLDLSESTNEIMEGSDKTVLQLTREAATLVSTAIEGIGDPFIILPRLFWCQNADVVDHSRRYQPAHHQ